MDGQESYVLEQYVPCEATTEEKNMNMSRDELEREVCTQS